MSRGKHRVRRLGRGTIALLVVLGVLIVGTTGTAFAAYRYDRSHAGRILPGVSIDGVAVGGMTRSQAIAAVSAVIEPRLHRSITITAGSYTWTDTVASLGGSADVDGTVDQALAVGGSFSWLARAYHRLMNKPVERSFTVPVSYDGSPVQAFVTAAAQSLAIAPRDASFELVDGKVVMVHAKTGKALQRRAATTQLNDAVRSEQGSDVALPLTTIEPKVPDVALGKHIIVDVSKNMLYLYDGFKIERTYQVATAMPGFVTPDGAWEVVNKVENPTWINPAPDGWGKDEPAMIPPGPGNPLGTRALYLNAPGIRIHGTPSDSSIGSYASHGCIRMHISESEALYPLVPIGTPVFIIGAPPWGVTTDPGVAG